MKTITELLTELARFEDLKTFAENRILKLRIALEEIEAIHRRQREERGSGPAPQPQPESAPETNGSANGGANGNGNGWGYRRKPMLDTDGARFSMCVALRQAVQTIPEGQVFDYAYLWKLITEANPAVPAKAKGGLYAAVAYVIDRTIKRVPGGYVRVMSYEQRSIIT